ncbi:dihydroxyacetone kinase subunit L [Rhizobiaceae bacterium BDR2-2]|uniref:Dihydroxyacetone kinase subunit L n=1 Tax=Ectorhizobium quercum TaxID=2965071 RepID=A0AAE3MZF0_9HYPH|nr:DAK2 domain-containing protein [Ectorhizobium quercum]MCX8996510.1 dihydroxyacetone kinase subunit L [Ectorhizobium quercum]
MIRSLDLIEMFSEIAVAMSENRERLCQLDGEDGDGDHGMTMTYVFTILEDTFSALDPARTTPAEIFDITAEAFLKIDAKSAELYASGFRRAGTTLMRRRQVTPEQFGKALVAMGSSFKEKGTPGVSRLNVADVWQLGVNAYLDSLEQGLTLSEALDTALTAANGGHVMADAGRKSGAVNQADFTGYDAGGASALLIFRAMRDTFS